MEVEGSAKSAYVWFVVPLVLGIFLFGYVPLVFGLLPLCFLFRFSVYSFCNVKRLLIQSSHYKKCNKVWWDNLASLHYSWISLTPCLHNDDDNDVI